MFEPAGVRQVVGPPLGEPAQALVQRQDRSPVTSPDLVVKLQGVLGKVTRRVILDLCGVAAGGSGSRVLPDERPRLAAVTYGGGLRGEGSGRRGLESARVVTLKKEDTISI